MKAGDWSTNCPSTNHRPKLPEVGSQTWLWHELTARKLTIQCFTSVYWNVRDWPLVINFYKAVNVALGNNPIHKLQEKLCHHCGSVSCSTRWVPCWIRVHMNTGSKVKPTINHIFATTRKEPDEPANWYEKPLYGAWRLAQKCVRSCRHAPNISIAQ